MKNSKFKMVVLALLCVLNVWTAFGDGTPVVPASQAEVNAGTVHSKFVAPDTLRGALTNGLGLLSGHRVYYMNPAGNNATAQANNASLPYASFYPTNTGVTTLATNGDTIFLYPGTYVLTNYLALNKGVTIEGFSRAACILVQSNYGGGSSEISIIRANDNIVLKNFSWYSTNEVGVLGVGFASFLFSQDAGFTNVVMDNLSLGSQYGPNDIFVTYSAADSSTTNTEYSATLKNSFVVNPWDFANFAGKGRYKITSQNNIWVALNTTNLGRILFSVNPGSIFSDFGSLFYNFGGTNTVNISQNWWAGNINLNGSKFYNSTNQFPLKPATAKTYANTSGSYYDATANIPYSWSADRSYYTVSSIITNGCLLTNTLSFGLFGGNITGSQHVFTNQTLPGSLTSFGKWVANDGSGAFCTFNDPTDPNSDGIPNFYIFGSTTNMLVDAQTPPFGISNFVLTDPNGSLTPPNSLVSNPTNYFSLSLDLTYRISTLDGGLSKNTNTVEVNTNLMVDGWEFHLTNTPTVRLPAGYCGDWVSNFDRYWVTPLKTNLIILGH